MSTIGFKGFGPKFFCRDFYYEVGKEYKTEEKIELCRSGFHFCKELEQVLLYYGAPGDRYAEVEILGDVIEGPDKCVTNHIRILREIPEDELKRRVNKGKWNTGCKNSGKRNTGDCNSGSCNTGHCNGGFRNTGDWNSGDFNAGSFNSGDFNTGIHNVGSRNTGSENNGFHNSGSRNTGHYNTGDDNTGRHNTGDWNVGDGNTGCFNTGTPTLTMFNRPSTWTLCNWWNSDACMILKKMPPACKSVKVVLASEMTDAEKLKHPEYATQGGYLKAAGPETDRQTWWDQLSEARKDIVMSLPNFDSEVFYKCTGIRVQAEKKPDPCPIAALYKGYVYFQTEEKTKGDAIEAFRKVCRKLCIGIGGNLFYDFRPGDPFYDFRPEDGELFADGSYLVVPFPGDEAFREDCQAHGINTDNLHLAESYA